MQFGQTDACCVALFMNGQKIIWNASKNVCGRAAHFNSTYLTSDHTALWFKE